MAFRETFENCSSIRLFLCGSPPPRFAGAQEVRGPSLRTAYLVVNFSDLYERRCDYVYFICARLEMEPESAEALFQDAWRRINRYLPQFDVSAEERWLCTKIADSHRKLQRRLSHRIPSGRLDGTSDEVRLAESLMSLDLEFRWPLVFREYAGFSYEDISQILGIPVGTVRARMGRARALLHQYRERGDVS